MLEEIEYPRKAVKYISLQRLETQALGGSIHYSKMGKLAYVLYERMSLAKKLFNLYSTKLEPWLRADSILRSYTEITAREFDTIRPHIGENVSTLIGIGAGMAGLEIRLSSYLRAKQERAPRIILIDKTGIDPIKYGFHEVASVYNSLDLARQSLELNGHPADAIEIVDADDAPSRAIDLAGHADLITSLIAWGFHFPVDAYLDFSREVLSPSGRLIIDVRKGTDGLDKLRSAFHNVTVIHQDSKFDRTLASQVRQRISAA